MAKEDAEINWNAVMAKALCYLSLHLSDLRKEKIAVQGKFLANFGLPRSTIADLLGTTENTVRVEMNKAAKSGVKKRVGKKEK